jgi:hypothetical protein
MKIAMDCLLIVNFGVWGVLPERFEKAKLVGLISTAILSCVYLGLEKYLQWI